MFSFKCLRVIHRLELSASNKIELIDFSFSFVSEKINSHFHRKCFRLLLYRSGDVVALYSPYLGIRLTALGIF